MRKGRIVILVVLIAAMIPLAGCYDRIDMENASFSLVIGYDVDADGNLVVYNSIPAFNKNAKKKSQEIVVRTHSSAESRVKSDAFTYGILHPRKLQVIVLSKALTGHKDWYRYLDMYFRDGRNPLTCRVMIFEGQMKDLFNFHPSDRPILPLQLLGLLDSLSANSETFDTTLQRLQTQMKDKGQSPALPLLSMNPDLNLSRTALLNRAGQYVLSLSSKEITLLRMMQSDNARIHLSLPMPNQLTGGDGADNIISITSDSFKSKIRVSHSRDRFRFDISMKLDVNLTEILFPIDIVKERAAFEQACEAELRKQMEALVAKLQAKKVDPIGFGDYARAFEYSAYKEVQDHWDEALQNAEFHVKVKVSLADIGAIE